MLETVSATVFGICFVKVFKLFHVQSFVYLFIYGHTAQSVGFQILDLGSALTLGIESAEF